MADFKQMLVVYDPTREEQPALERAARIATLMSAKVKVFACIFTDTAKSAGKSTDVRGLVAEQQNELERIVAPLINQGIEVSTEVEWDKDWPHAVVRASLRNDADLVLKSSYKYSPRKRKLKRTSDWTLIRECLCPVLLVKSNETRDFPLVLAAIDIQARQPSYELLNQNIIEFGRQLFEGRGVEVHFVNAFEDFRVVPNREELIQNCGIETDRIHIKMGSPEKVIVEQARLLGASLVVVGNSARSGLLAVLVGNTVEKILDKVNCNVLSIPVAGLSDDSGEEKTP